MTLADGPRPRWPAGAAGGDNLAPGEPVAYGFGWFLDPWRGRRRTWHHGETSGFRAAIERFPDDIQYSSKLFNVRSNGKLEKPWHEITRRYWSDEPNVVLG